MATALTPLFGVFATFSVLEGWVLPWNKFHLLFPVFIIGVITHVFGEILNDYKDYEIDKNNIELSEKPLVSGAISKKGALILLLLVLVVLIATIVIYRFNILSLLMLLMTAICGIVYNIKSKDWVYSPPVILAGYPFFLILFGGIYAGDYNNLFDVPGLVYIIALLGAFQLWINTAILGHLKDVKNDSECGVVTFPIRLGVKVGKGEPPKLIVPSGFRILTIGVQIVNLAVAFIPILFYKLFYDGDVNILLLAIGISFLTIIIMASQIRIMWHKFFERNKLMRMMAVREIAAYFLSLVLVSPLIGLVLVIVLLVLPLLWFLIVNFFISGNPMQSPI
jgi:4-hydroxybenzoate polyprenyltransferase